MPKGRYKIMTAYMPKVGKLGLDMMYRTCTVQTNLDFSSESDMVKKLRVSIALQPVSIEGQNGLNVAAGVVAMTLTFNKNKPAKSTP